MTTCAVADCDRVTHSCGYCSRHYNRFRRHGDPLLGDYERDHSVLQCASTGCDCRVYAKGMCQGHYQRTRRLAAADGPIPERVRYSGTECLEPDCQAVAYGLGLCKPHYQRKYRSENADLLSTHARMRRQRMTGVLKLRHTKQQFLDRMAVWGNRCWMCGGPFECLDHVKPISKGGADCLANYRPACNSCNASKGAKWFGASELHRFVKT